MAITGIDAARIVSDHALGGDPIHRVVDTDSTYSAIAIANDAGRWLLDARSWNWASGARATIGTTASQAYTDLPADFQEFIGQPFKTNGLVGGFEWVSLPTLLQLIIEAPSTTGDYFYGALTWDQSGAGAPVAQIQFHPTPNSTDATAFTAFYRRAWTDFAAPADSTAAKIPTWMEGLYVGALEAFARGWEDGIAHPAIRQQYIDGLMKGPEWAAAVRRDTNSQTSYGVIKNGVLSSRGRHWSRVAGVAAPS